MFLKLYFFFVDQVPQNVPVQFVPINVDVPPPQYQTVPVHLAPQQGYVLPGILIYSFTHLFILSIHPFIHLFIHLNVYFPFNRVFLHFI